MKVKPVATLLFNPTDRGHRVFSSLLQGGFVAKSCVDVSLTDLLHDQFGLSHVYIEERIKTVFLEGKPVDDFETTIIRDGSTLALSAAMPGLVGAVFRKGGVLSPLRSTISHRGSDTVVCSRQGSVCFKLFNLLTGEIGAVFMAQGIYIRPEVAKRFFSLQPDTFWQSCKTGRINGENVPKAQLMDMDWSGLDGLVSIRIDSALDP